ncbi:MAG: phosphatidate cytidylyltransferase [Candidatus Nanopelagicales bacterium]
MRSRRDIKTGRNLPLATAVGLFLFGLVLLSTFVANWLFLPLLTLFVLLAASELIDVLNRDGITVSKRAVQLVIPIMFLAAYFGGLAELTASYAFGIFVLLIASLKSGTVNFIERISKSILVLTYLPFMAAFVLLMLNQSDGALRVLAFILLTVASDTGAYFAGILFGKHAMAPEISPAKTWEGFVGGLLLQLVMGAVIFPAFFGASIWLGLLAGFLMTITAVLGDLLESAIKRDAGIKDMSGVLPGHGGVLDRLDSLIPNALVAWVLFGWLLP